MRFLVDESPAEAFGRLSEGSESLICGIGSNTIDKQSLSIVRGGRKETSL